LRTSTRSDDVRGGERRRTAGDEREEFIFIEEDG
jgi:hypothetical protein